jgi:hypothetical protein
MYDEALGKLREARALLLEERDSGKNSRELSVTLTEIDTAILWRQEDLRLKTPPVNEATSSLPRVFGVSRVADNSRAVLLTLISKPTDDDLRAIHDRLGA